MRLLTNIFALLARTLPKQPKKLSAGMSGPATAVVMSVMIGLMAAGPCGASIEGLLQIPTADLTAPGEFAIEVSNNGAFNSADTDTLIESQFGLTPRLSVGFDADPGEDGSLHGTGSVKYLLVPGSERHPAVAVGVHSVGVELVTGPYLTIANDFGGFRGHVGLMHIEHENRWFMGADKAINDRLLLEADYISGQENGASAGLVYGLGHNLSLEAGMLLPNEDAADTGFVVNLIAGPIFSHSRD